MTLALTGHAVARGIAIGRCHLVERSELDIVEYRIGPEEVDREIQRYRHAVDAARQQLEEIASTSETITKLETEQKMLFNDFCKKTR